jgi:WD40 repeat protein
MTNLVAYRGHQNPVWDVKWSPMGVYFATASRDRTARLWSTDRTTALRIYAGHLSDVDVGSSSRFGGMLLKALAVSELPPELIVSGDGIK